jgi:rRNA maturation endonuclease Nob1
LLAGADPRGTPEDLIYITPLVMGELKHDDDKARIETLKELGLLTQSPSAESLRAIEEASQRTGDSQRLSPVDKELLALTLELKAELLTDDRSMQNTAKALNLPYRGYAQSEIKGVWHWESIWRCIGCGREYDQELPKGICRVCGHEIRKKHWRVPMGEAAGRPRKGKNAL